MWWVVVVGFLLLSSGVLSFLHRVTKLDHIPAYVSVLAFVAFFIPTSIVILLPIDLASGRADFENTASALLPLSYLKHAVLLRIWRASYWLSFSLTLTILPITQSFVESGYREPLHRFLSSIRHNLRFQAIYLSVALFGVLYIALNTNLRTFSDYRSLLIALANTWGLFLAINLLGHGLVNLPRRIWHSADYARQIRDIENRASIVHEKLEDATTEENELAAKIVELEKTSADKEWLEEMASIIPSAVAKARATSNRNHSRSWFNGNSAPKPPTDEEMAGLMNCIRTSKKERYAAEWRQLLTRYTYFLDCTNASASRTLVHRTFRSRLSPRVAYIYYVHVVPLATRLAAVCAGLLSASILWAEVLINEQERFLRFVTLPITEWNIEIFSALLLAYMASCCYSTLLRLKIFDRYALLDHGHTSPSSLFFYASYLCRVTIPLSYNFITLLPVNHRDLSTFSKFLASAIDLSPLGTAFNNWFPLYILLPVSLTLLNSYDKLKRKLSLNSTWIMEDEDEEDGSSPVGRSLLTNDIGQNYGELPTRQTNVPQQTFGSTHHVRIRNEEEGAEDTAPFLESEPRTSESRDGNGSTRLTASFLTYWGNFKEQINGTLSATNERLHSWSSDETRVI